jgi:hypothetical protein
MSFLLTAWAKDPSTEHALLGWAMRAIADKPVVSSSFLNAVNARAFRPDETADLAASELTNDEVFQLITVPARVASSTRRVTLHLPAARPWQNAWAELFIRICGPPLAPTT